MFHYEFTLKLNGYGETPEEAWGEIYHDLVSECSEMKEEEITFIEEVDDEWNEFEPRRILLDKRLVLPRLC